MIDLLSREAPAQKQKKKAKGKAWNFNFDDDNKDSNGVAQEAGEDGEQQDMLDLDKERKETATLEEDTLFAEKVSEACDLQIAQNQYMLVKVGPEVLQSMDIEDVFMVDYRRYNPEWQIKYYKKVDREADLMSCSECGSIFFSEEFDLYYMQHKCCPYCKSKHLTF